LLKQIEDFKK
jgi:chromosome segregation ATPase